ncbi:MAG: 2-hydroxyhepta-2,4-diene-1,7-dioate isomerase [Planctomycetaceae bacterium]|nr:2-hydroxyhepta-2,4-diene-1,7-dioate isomerase [Planctomycetaceae bacterium]
MKLAKVELPGGEQRVAVLVDDGVYVVAWSKECRSLSDLLHSDNPIERVRSLFDANATLIATPQVRMLAPLDHQEVWAAGVTYKRSQVARMEESESAASHYDRVYTAPRPELFFKAMPRRVAGPGQPVRIRTDTKWSVPEPELALVISPAGKLVGFTAGNDMSARDIEGENPLYLPQAKLYNDCCALGPCILIPEQPLDLAATCITLVIHRNGTQVFRGETHLDQMKRSFDELIDWLFRDNSFPDGVILLTGTGIVPPNEFSLVAGDLVSIDISGIGTLSNPVVQG